MMSNKDIQSPTTSFDFPDRLNQILSFFCNLLFNNIIFTKMEEKKDIALTYKLRENNLISSC